MLNFTVGPVQIEKNILNLGAEQIPYFRTSEFSQTMFENERLIQKFAGAASGARTVFITGSGTASMEAAVVNAFTVKDKVLVINGGSFGQRFVQLCKIYKIPYTEIKIQFGKDITSSQLEQYENQGYTGLLVNIHETSTGVRYDLNLISRFCKKNNIFLVVDAISSFLADPIHMEHEKIDILLTGSQKALACPPGVSIVVMSSEAVERIKSVNAKCMYLNLCNALKDGERGQTPFTPAVGILRQINSRLKQIDENGGVEIEISRIRGLAFDFREKIKDLPFKIVSEALSNAVTPLHPLNASAYDIFMILKNEYNIWVCPNGGELADKIFRVGHIGNLTKNDNTILVEAFIDLKRRNII